MSREAPGPVGPLAAQGPFAPNVDLFVCRGISASNAPVTDTGGRVVEFKPLVIVNGIVLASVPVNDACMTSGFGPRFGRVHKGIDIQSFLELTVYSAGPGVIREARVAQGYGNYVLIDHGGGVFTRYAHLERFGIGIVKGARIAFGQPIGLMGDSGNATSVHLHFEVLTGNYSNPRGGFGLNAYNPLDWPEFVVEGVGPLSGEAS